MKKRKDIGSVVEHSGSIASLEFFGTSHLLTGSEDGKVALFRTSDWECLHVLLHKTPVSSVGVHPSGKLAISVSAKDKSLRLWNLVTGKGAGRIRTSRPVDRVGWSPSGKRFVLQSETGISVFDAASTSKAIIELTSPSKILTSAMVDDDTILLAGEGSALQVVRITASNTATVVSKDLQQKPRIKSICLVEGVLVTIASDGSLAFWSLQDILSKQAEIEPIGKHTIPGLRPICMTATILK